MPPMQIIFSSKLNHIEFILCFSCTLFEIHLLNQSQNHEFFVITE